MAVPWSSIRNVGVGEVLTSQTACLCFSAKTAGSVKAICKFLKNNPETHNENVLLQAVFSAQILVFGATFPQNSLEFHACWRSAGAGMRGAVVGAETVTYYSDRSLLCLTRLKALMEQ